MDEKVLEKERKTDFGITGLHRFRIINIIEVTKHEY
jgi:hypothetical protein